ncbi:MAG: hypothetical protein AB7Q29_11930 [Vicinamibacterales bacterium]
MLSTIRLVCLLAFAATVSACQSPTSASDTLGYDDAVDVTTEPNPISANTSSDGRTYRIVRGNNQPDEIVPYDWHATFTSTLSFNSTAADDDLDVAFPVRLSAATLVVKQASGGIITPPTGTDKEYYEFVTLNASGNQFGAIGNPVNLTFEIWYDLPSLRKEAVVTMALSFIDDDGVTFQVSKDINVAP